VGRNTFSPAAACPAADSIFDSVQSVATARTRWCACSTVTNVPFYTTHASHYLLKCCDRVALPLLSLGFLAPEARRAVDAARLCGCPAALLLLPLPLCVLAPRLLTVSHHKNTGYFFHPRIFIFSLLSSLSFAAPLASRGPAPTPIKHTKRHWPGELLSRTTRIIYVHIQLDIGKEI